MAELKYWTEEMEEVVEYEGHACDLFRTIREYERFANS
jgi:hypothetical protein